MSRSLLLLLTLFSLGLAVACDATDGTADSSEQSGMLGGLLDKAKGVMSGFEGSEGAASGAGSSLAADPIVRCEVDGSVRFTNQSNCPGGTRMALKAKNQP